jgi:hypothetical protein
MLKERVRTSLAGNQECSELPFLLPVSGLVQISFQNSFLFLPLLATCPVHLVFLRSCRLQVPWPAVLCVTAQAMSVCLGLDLASTFCAVFIPAKGQSYGSSGSLSRPCGNLVRRSVPPPPPLLCTIWRSMPPSVLLRLWGPPSGLSIPYKYRRNRDAGAGVQQSAAPSLLPPLLLDLSFVAEEGCDMFLRNVG